MANYDERQLAEIISDSVNSYTFSTDKFNEVMSGEHRTLQQSFTRLCLAWLEHCAGDEYRTDLRNEASANMAKLLTRLHTEHWEKQGFDGFGLTAMSHLPNHLPMV